MTMMCGVVKKHVSRVAMGSKPGTAVFCFGCVESMLGLVSCFLPLVLMPL